MTEGVLTGVRGFRLSGGRSPPYGEIGYISRCALPAVQTHDFLPRDPVSWVAAAGGESGDLEGGNAGRGRGNSYNTGGDIEDSSRDCGASFDGCGVEPDGRRRTRQGAGGPF